MSRADDAVAAEAAWGPLAEEIHGIDERVSLRSMVDVARVLARFVLDWCGESTQGEAHGRS